MKPCAFCKILAGETAAYIVFEDEISVAFLDYRPLLKGHCLLVPRSHYGTLLDLPAEEAGPLLRNAQTLMRAFEKGLAADGSFVAVNVKVSQSVPHLHLHLIPRWHKDGLFARPFFWLRKPQSQAAMRAVQAAIRGALEAAAAIEPRAGDAGAVPPRPTDNEAAAAIEPRAGDAGAVPPRPTHNQSQG